MPKPAPRKHDVGVRDPIVDFGIPAAEDTPAAAPVARTRPVAMPSDDEEDEDASFVVVSRTDSPPADTAAGGAATASATTAATAAVTPTSPVSPRPRQPKPPKQLPPEEQSTAAEPPAPAPAPAPRRRPTGSKAVVPDPASSALFKKISSGCSTGSLPVLKAKKLSLHTDKDLPEWTVDEVVEWLHTLHGGEFAKYEDVFRKSNVDGTALSQLDSLDSLKSMMPSVGHRTMLKKAIRDLKPQSEV
eukprot:m.179399 g.179399  ORF g.179399 m.179399 type:complete len:245 (+) comp21442_c0_seq3:2989-3723(+)